MCVKSMAHLAPRSLYFMCIHVQVERLTIDLKDFDFEAFPATYIHPRGACICFWLFLLEPIAIFKLLGVVTNKRVLISERLQFDPCRAYALF